MTEIENWCAQEGISILKHPGEEIPLLGQISRTPEKLYVLGDVEVLTHPSLSIVGTRRPSAYGIKAAMEFSRQLALLGIPVVSGMARGIDSAAHRGSLIGKGKTVAVLGHGLAYRYPPENRLLADQIVASGGCLVSEFDPFVPPAAKHFPQRNRLISGLSLGTLVIEAAEKSGSLITAKLAMEQNREVYVLPSRYDERNFDGSHRLLQQGAKLIVDVGDILEEIKNLLDWNTPERDKSEVSNTAIRQLFLEKAKSSRDKRETVALSLSEVYRSVGQWGPQVIQELLTAVASGEVVECAPQIYIWMGK